ncbi:MAG: serine hydrolase domain-containing protein [Planctomycetota bacterium]
MTKNHMPSISVALVVIFFLFTPVRAENVNVPDGMEQAIDRLVKSFEIDPSEPGIAVLINKPGHLLFMKGYGLASLKLKSPITPKTVFELASVSKTMTATAVLKLHERGEWSIQDDIRKYIPELPAYAPAHPIRLKDMLNHISGLPSYFDLLENAPKPPVDYWSNESATAEFARQKKAFPLDFPTGAKYEYNNSNYMLMGTALSRKLKRPFAALMRDEIFAPCGMKHTYVYETPESVPALATGCNHAIGYEWDSKKESWKASWGCPPDRNEKDLEVGDGGIWTNLEDMLRWDTAIREHKLIKLATMKIALSPSKTGDGETNAYGLGWILYANDDGVNYGFGHDGYWGGFSTTYYNYLTQGHTVVLLSNRGRHIDLDKFWEKLDVIITKYSRK